MRELCTHTGIFYHRKNLCFLPCFFFVSFHVTIKWGGTGVPCHIQQSKANLTQAGISGIEIRRIYNALYQFVRDEFSGLIMSGKCVEELLFNSEVLHELRGKFHKVPIYICTAQVFIGGIREHTMQAMPKFMQECLQFTKCQ